MISKVLNYVKKYIYVVFSPFSNRLKLKWVQINFIFHVSKMCNYITKRN